MELLNPNTVQHFSSASSRLDVWHRFITVAHIRTIAEVGVWKGDFAADILNCSADIDKYYMIDPWAHLPDWNKPFNVTSTDFDSVYHEALSKTAFATERTVILRGKTTDVVHKIPDNSLDLVYIDGDHTLRGITIDLISLFPKVKTGGFIGGDDLTQTPWQHGTQYEPTLVFPFCVYFSEANGIPLIALPYNQFVMQKLDGPCFSFVDTTGQYSDTTLLSLLRLHGMMSFKRRMYNKMRNLIFGRP